MTRHLFQLGNSRTCKNRPAERGGFAEDPGLDYLVSELLLARLSVRGVLVAARAVLLQLESIRVVTPVLLRDVVTFLALHAGQRDLRAYVGGCHGSDSYFQTIKTNLNKGTR
jgi:hypothetical protein